MVSVSCIVSRCSGVAVRAAAGCWRNLLQRPGRWPHCSLFRERIYRGSIKEKEDWGLVGQADAVPR